MYTSCCASIGQCQMVAEAGFDRVVLSASELVRASPKTLRMLAGSLTRWDLECRSLNDFCPPELKLCGPDYHLAQVKQYLQTLVPKCAALGVRQIGVGAPLSRMLPGGYPQGRGEKQLLEWLLFAVRLCRPHGIQILLEPVCSQMTNFLNGTADVLRLTDACDGMGMVYDIYHAWRMGEPPAAMLPAVRKIEMVHIAHAGHGRQLPTRETITRYVPYLQCLMDAGYLGEIAVEGGMEGVDPALLAESCQALKRTVQKTRPVQQL